MFKYYPKTLQESAIHRYLKKMKCAAILENSLFKIFLNQVKKKASLGWQFQKL